MNRSFLECTGNHSRPPVQYVLCSSFVYMCASLLFLCGTRRQFCSQGDFSKKRKEQCLLKYEGRWTFMEMSESGAGVPLRHPQTSLQDAGRADADTGLELWAVE